MLGMELFLQIGDTEHMEYCFLSLNYWGSCWPTRHEDNSLVRTKKVFMAVQFPLICVRHRRYFDRMEGNGSVQRLINTITEEEV